MMRKLFDGPKVDTKQEQAYVAIPVEMAILDREIIAALVEEVYSWMERRGIKPEGKPFCRYWIMGGVEEKYHLEVGLTVARMVAGDERVISSFIPGGAYATALHHGTAEYLVDSSYALEKWAVDEGLELDKRYEEDTEIWNGRFEFYPAIPDGDLAFGEMVVEIAYLLMRDAAA